MRSSQHETASRYRNRRICQDHERSGLALYRLCRLKLVRPECDVGNEMMNSESLRFRRLEHGALTLPPSIYTMQMVTRRVIYNYQERTFLCLFIHRNINNLLHYDGRSRTKGTTPDIGSGEIRLL